MKLKQITLNIFLILLNTLFYYLLFFITSFSTSSNVHAQSISIGQSAAGVFSDEGDYFTDILGKSKTFNSACDIIDDQHYYSTKIFQNSTFIGSSSGKNSPIFSLLHVPTINTAITQKIECGPDAFQKDILAQNYQLLSFKSRTNFSPTHSAMFWSLDKNNPINGGFMPIGAQIGTPRYNPFSYNINWFFLPGNTSFSTNWSGKLTSLTLAPTLSQPIGSTSELDWVRLVNTNNSNFIRFNWNTNSNNVASPKVSIYVDNNNIGFDGIKVFEQEPINSFRDFPLGMLEPGTYYAYASLDSVIGGISTPVVYSQYSSQFTINAKPQIKVLAPTKFSGFEYSRDERGDPWDFNSLTDLSNVPNGINNPPQNFRYFHDWFISNGVFFAESDPNNSNTIGDVQLHPTVTPNKPIRTNLYRFFCVKMQFDPKNMPRNGDLQGLNDAGWYARVMYSNSKVANTFGSTKGFQVIETSTSFPDYQSGFNTYCLDLWDTDVHDSGARFKDISIADGIRFDPHEAYDPTKFAIDSIGLYTENYTNKDGIYKTKWTLSDIDSQNFTIKIFIDSDNQNFNGTLIKTVTQNSVGNGETDINLSGLSNGTYHIYFEISDGINTHKYYADEPIKKVTSPPAISNSIKHIPCDKDGDSLSDFTMIRNFRGAAQWITLTQSLVPLSSLWGFPFSDLFIDSDFDGDKKSDQQVVRRSNQIEWWNIESATSQGNLSYWGQLGDQPLTADFDGDSKSDRSIFRETDGSWWTILSSGGVTTKIWGLKGDVPVAEDFDGDGKADYAIYRPWNGIWAITKSSGNYSSDPSNVIWRQWGFPEDLAMPGDYTGDGISDLVVWRPSNGTWYICSSETNFDCSQGRAVQFGFPNDIPVKFNNDGNQALDYTVFRPSTGQWFMKSSSDVNTISAKLFGSNIDYPLCSSPSILKSFVR